MEDPTNFLKATLESEWNIYGIGESIALKLSIEFSQHLLPDTQVEVIPPENLNIYPAKKYQVTRLQQHPTEILSATEDLVYSFFQNTIAFFEAGLYQISCDVSVKVWSKEKKASIVSLPVSHRVEIRKYLDIAEIDRRICDLLWEEHCLRELDEPYYRKQSKRSDEEVAKDFEDLEERIKELVQYIARSDFDKMLAQDFAVDTILRLSFYHPEDDTIARAKKYLANPDFYELDYDDIQMAQMIIAGNY
ncbi:hypothetical protein BKI52_30460 [marine bacterium AO1-C]|nr:hypothetical protein BKI52_30460 [marine bacterium AO1-C]